jgi:hypothetical protein
MAEKSYQDAVQALKAQLGGQWNGEEIGGRDDMVKILKDKLGYDSTAANDAIDAMIAAGTLRYHRAREVGGDEVVPAPIGPTGEGTVAGIPAAGGFSGMPVAPGLIPGMGYWQIGEDQGDVPPGRAGQVQPS